ncbi:MAG: hypothetical protein AAFV80_08845, partial [Bacteroidota bacterium]
PTDAEWKELAIQLGGYYDFPTEDNIFSSLKGFNNFIINFNRGGPGVMDEFGEHHYEQSPTYYYWAQREEGLQHLKFVVDSVERHPQNNGQRMIGRAEEGNKNIRFQVLCFCPTKDDQ